MARNHGRGWAWWLVRVVAVALAICTIHAVITTALPGVKGRSAGSKSSYESSTSRFDSTSNDRSCPSRSGASTSDNFLLMVSTIDGALSALDMREKGQILWSFKPDDRPLLSSSISNIQVTRNGVLTRLIPSLDGSLYEFDGTEVKAIPMTAESLLSASLRINDNFVMVGGRDVQTYGVDLKTGQMVYKCAVEGCEETSEASNENGDMLLLKRSMKTVRAVDISSGAEKWNFSVGQHELVFVDSKKSKPDLKFDAAASESEVDEDVTITTCNRSDEDISSSEEEQLKHLIKVMVADGLVVGLNPEDPSQMSWSRQFSSPVARAWILYHGQLERVSLFDTKVVPALSAGEHPFHSYRHERKDPLLYVGTHNRQVYVQTQETESDSCEQDLPWLREQEAREDTLASVPRISWRPYILTKYQTPLFGGNVPPEIPLLGENGQDEHGEESSHSLTVWNENYPFDMGYYLYPQHSAKQGADGPLETPLTEEGILDVLPASLWMWWKEVLAISLLTSLFVHILLTRIMHRHPLIVEVTSQSELTKENSEPLVTVDSYPTLAQTSAEFKSRFAEEFECLEKVGKGGYGVVFRAKNKVDEQEYAVKRIALLKSDDESIKLKMKREVIILAKLTHIGIVRYFHSWFEYPPLGWQEARDKEICDRFGDCITPAADMTVTTTDLTRTSEYSHIPFQEQPKQENIVKGNCSLLDEIMPGMRNDFESNSQSFPKGLTSNSSGEFSVHSNMEGFTDESGSFSFNGDNEEHREVDFEDSFSVVFQNSDAESSHSRGYGDVSGTKSGVSSKVWELSSSGEGSVPFRQYGMNKRHSSTNPRSEACLDPEGEEDSIVFEDSRSQNKDSIVFEDSGSQNKDSTVFKDSCRKSKDRSLLGVCSDSSYGGSTGDKDSGDYLHNTHNLVEFTLSSHGLQEPTSEEQHEEKIKKDKSAKPKEYLYLQMELCRSDSLRDWLMANTLNRERTVILDIFEQIVNAVEYVHSKGHIHRDLKPSNIFFALDGIVKVGDFGLVANHSDLENSQDTSGNKTSARHTAEVGTQLYMSPEQVQKKPYDQKVDIFSLGLIFLELLMPFSTGMERVTTLQNARKGIFPERFCRELPVESDLVRQLTSADPQKRPTAQQILEHDLLKDFAPRRLSFHPRSRTISGSSSQHHSEPIFASEKAL